MTLSIPSRREVVASLEAYGRANLPELEYSITKRRGFIGGLLRSLGSALHDWYVALKRYGEREPFPQTATGEFLFQGWWSDITQLERKSAAAARGRVVVTGTPGAILPVDTELEYGGRSYTVDNSVTVSPITLSLLSLTRDDTTAIAETREPHYLASGMTVQISGANQTDYNGAFLITVTAPTEFTYEVDNAPATPATGAVMIAATFAVASVTAATVGADTNIPTDAALTLSPAPEGVDPQALTTFGGIIDGSDLEEIETFRERVIEALGVDFGIFSAAEIKVVAKQVPGVTRVWVREASLNGTNGVQEGQVIVAFLRDNDANPLPSSLEVTQVKNHIVTNIMPAHTAEEDVMVVSPTAVTVNFAFTALSPDTTSMRLAIRARLRQFFAEEVDFGVTLTEDDYRCAILSTFDAERGQSLKSFALSAPSGDIAVAWNELPRLGTITWP